jgi:hypothetical protein
MVGVRGGIAMSQRTVERVIGGLVTDEEPNELLLALHRAVGVLLAQIGICGLLEESAA